MEQPIRNLGCRRPRGNIKKVVTKVSDTIKTALSGGNDDDDNNNNGEGGEGGAQ